MAGLEQKVKQRHQVHKLKVFFGRGVRIVRNSCKNGWYKVKHIRGQGRRHSRTRGGLGTL